MKTTIYKAKIRFWNEIEQGKNNITEWIGEGNDQVALYNWCIEQWETLQEKYKHVYWYVVVEDEIEPYGFMEEEYNPDKYIEAYEEDTEKTEAE